LIATGGLVAEEQVSRDAKPARVCHGSAGFSSGIPDAVSPGMCGFITERDFKTAEATFPGIERFFAQLEEKPQTFLNLLWMFLGQSEPRRQDQMGQRS
jgi:hypothetical protein